MSERLVVSVDGEKLAFDVAEIRQVVADVRVHPLPDRFGALAGFVSLRGRVATAVDVARCLGRPAARREAPAAVVVVRFEGEDYALLVDRVDDLARPDPEPLGPEAAAGLAPDWRELVRAVHRLPDGLVAEIDLARLLRAAGTAGRQGEAA